MNYGYYGCRGITVNEGGSLVLDNAKATYSGNFITINDGGSISFNNSTIAGGFTSYGDVISSDTVFNGQITISGGSFADSGSSFKGKLSVSGNTEVSLTDSIVTDVNGISIAKGGELTLMNVSFVNHAKLTIAAGATVNINQCNGYTLVAEAGAFLNLFGYTIAAEEMLNVLNKCSANDIHIESTGEMRIKDGGRGSGITLESGSYLFAESGASISDVTVTSGAYIEIADGATALNVSLGTGVFVAGITNEGENPLLIGRLSGETVTGEIKNGTISGALKLGDGATVSGLSGNFTLEISDLSGNYSITGNDFSQVTLDLTGEGIIDLSGNYWGTTDIDAIYERLGVDSSMVRIDDVLGRNPNAAAFALESTNLTKNYLAPGQTSISFVFNALLDADSISTDAITFVSTSGKVVNITQATVQDNVLTIEFDELTTEGFYTIRFADTIRDVDGNTLTSLRNDALADGIGEQLRITARLSGASVVKVAPAGDVAGTLTTFQVYFNKTVDSSTLKDNVRLIAPDGTSIAPTAVRMLNDSTAEFTVPAQTAAGRYSVLVSSNVADYAGTLLDQNGNGIGGEADDGYASTFALTEIDLAVKDVQVADTLTNGEDAAITWKVANESGTALMGSWTDGVYLSTDARWDIGDTLLATYTHENGLNAGQTLVGEASLKLLGVKEGSYYLLVRSDIHNDEDAGIAASTAAQNLVATRITVEIPQLSVGETATGSFAASGDFATYRVHQNAGEALQLVLDSQIDAANLEFYVGYGYAPSREQYDAKLQRITDATMSINAGIVPRDVYVLVYAKSTSEAFDYTLSASKAPAAIDKISQSSQDASEAITLTITGKNFTNGMTARLVSSDGTVTVLDNLKLSGTTKLTATIAADTLATGDYTLELVDGESTVAGNQPVSVSAIAGEGKLEHSFYAPSTVGRHANHTLYLTISNTGTAAIDAPLVFFTPTQSHANGTETMGAILSLRYDQSAFWVSTIPAGYSDSLSFFVNGETSGTIQPGESVSVPIYYTGWRTDDWDFGDSHINWNVSVLYANDSTPLLWSDVFQNSGLSVTTEQELAQAFSAEFGDTWGGYYEMVVGNLHYLDEIGVSAGTVDSSSMLRFEAMQKAGVLQPFHNLVETEDLALAGNSIAIQRTYDIGQGTMEEAGSFGYGWTFNWDVRLTTTSAGDVQIVQGGTRRIYQPTATFSYQSVSKDGSSLKNNSTGYRLTDADGSQWQFDTDGRLLYVIEATGERISCTYNANGQLSRLTNTSTGSFISIVRDADTGLITALKDSTGKGISYGYSEDDDLVSVTDSTKNVIATYEYYASTEHALTKATDSEGISTAYAYDEIGRIVSIANADGTTTLAYGTAGEVTMTNGDSQITLYYAPNGNIAKITDNVTGKVYSYTYNANGEFVSGKESDGNALASQFSFAGQEIDVCYTGVDFSNLVFNAVYNTNINSNHYTVDGITYYKTDKDGNILRQNDTADEYYVVGYDAEDELKYYLIYKDGVNIEKTYSSANGVNAIAKDVFVGDKQLDIQLSLDGAEAEDGYYHATVTVTNISNADAYAPIVTLAGSDGLVFSENGNNVFSLYAANYDSETPGFVAAGSSYSIDVAYTKSEADATISLSSIKAESQKASEAISLDSILGMPTSYFETNYSDLLTSLRVTIGDSYCSYLATLANICSQMREANYYSINLANFNDVLVSNAYEKLNDLNNQEENRLSFEYDFPNTYSNENTRSSLEYGCSVWGSYSEYSLIPGGGLKTVRVMQVGEIEEKEYSNTYILIHGNLADWNGVDWPWGTAFKIRKQDPEAQILIVDWDSMSNFTNTGEVDNGDHIETVVRFMSLIFGLHPLSSSNVTLIGHSYGAHIAGGLVSQGIIPNAKRLIALDPASITVTGAGQTNIPSQWELDNLPGTLVEVYKSSNGFGTSDTYGNINFVVAKNNTLNASGFTLGYKHSYAWQWFNTTINQESTVGWGWNGGGAGNNWVGVIGESNQIQGKIVSENSYSGAINAVAKLVDYRLITPGIADNQTFKTNKEYTIQVGVTNDANNTAYEVQVLKLLQKQQGSSVKVWLSADSVLDEKDVLLGVSGLALGAGETKPSLEINLDFGKIKADDYLGHMAYIIIQAGGYSYDVQTRDRVEIGLTGSYDGQDDGYYKEFVAGELDSSNNWIAVPIQLRENEAPYALIKVSSDKAEVAQTGNGQTSYSYKGDAISCYTATYTVDALSEDGYALITLNGKQSYDSEDKYNLKSYDWFESNENGAISAMSFISSGNDKLSEIQVLLPADTSKTYLLKVTDSDGYSDYHAVNISVINSYDGSGNPIANAGKSQSHSFAKNETSFSFTVNADKSKAFNDATIDRYYWDFDGRCFSTLTPELNFTVTQHERKETDESGKETISYSYSWVYKPVEDTGNRFTNNVVSLSTNRSSLDIALTVEDSNALMSLNTSKVVLSVSSDTSGSTDPNDKTVAEGVGEAGYVQAGSKLSYKVEFENDPEFATAPAQWVRVFDTLDGSKYDLDSFVLEEFCIAGNSFVVGDGRDSFNRTVELAILDYTITATISINLVTEEDTGITQMVAEFMAVDPESGFMLQDLENGLLPVNDAFGSGEGHISYTINALDDLPSGTEITNTAKIYFDFNDPIDTPTTLNTIDADVPSAVDLTLSADDDGLITLAMSAEDVGSGVEGYNVRWSTDGEHFIDYGYTTYTQLQLPGRGGVTYHFQIQAVDAVGQVSEWSAVQSIEISGVPTDLEGTSGGISWKPVAGSDSYVVEYSTDAFEHFVRLQVAGTSLDAFSLPQATYQWRVRAADLDEWEYGEEIVAPQAISEPQFIQSNADGTLDAFFVNIQNTWGGNYQARHVGVGDWTGTGQTVALTGKNVIADIYAGSDDASVLLLTDDANGDALFVDDIYSAFPAELDVQARIAQIDEIRAGVGNDIVDLTSQRFDYIGGGMTVRGGLGDDVIWANKGDNWLFGDAGNDNIVGAGGNDVIVGGAGDDTLHGGGGNDIFAFGGDWGKDTMTQLETGKVTLWFADGDETKWNADSLTYTDGDNSVKVSGVALENISLKFGDDGSQQYQNMLAAGAFNEFTSEKIFEDKNRGMLA
ncbi:MAG: hypothetical protein II943_02540 [Victivallales bacterium]|nr:hypothetical protein [Victivallales bacterium]